MATTKSLIFQSVKVDTTTYTLHLMEEASVDISENEDAVENNQKLPASYDVEFSVTVYDTDVLTDSNIFSDTSGTPVKADMEFTGETGSATLTITDVIISLRPTFDQNRVAYVLSGRKRGIDASTIVGVS